MIGPRAAAGVVAAGLAGLLLVGTLVPAPAETVRESRPGVVEPIAAATVTCPWLEDARPVRADLTAGTLPADVLPEGTAGEGGAGSAVTLAGAEDDGETVLELGPRGSAASARVGTDEPTAVAVEAEGALAPGLVAEALVEGSSAEERGLAGLACTAAVTSAWFVGPGAAVGSRPRLVLANPTDVPAVVTVYVWDESGAVSAPGAEDLGVPARGQRQLQLDALAPGSQRLAVGVDVTAGRVSAAVQQVEVDGLDPAGLSWVPVGSAPASRLVVPGVPGSGRRTLLVAAPGEEDAVVTLRLLGARGPFSAVGAEVVTVQAGRVAEVDLTQAAEDEPVAVVLESDVPVVAGVRVVASGRGGPPDTAFTGAVPPLAGPAATTVPPSSRLRSSLLLSAVGTDANAVVRFLAPDGREVSTEDVAVGAGATVALALEVPEAARGGLVVVEPEAPDALVVARWTSGSDDGALVDLVPLRTPRSLVRVPEVATDLSTGLSTGVDVAEE